LPALNRAKAKALQVSCLNNKRQIILAWLMYPDDNSTRLPTAALWLNLLAGTCQTFEANFPPNTNVLPLITTKGEFPPDPNPAWAAHPPGVDIGGGALGAYVRSPAPYKCPADRSMVAFSDNSGQTVTLPRVRSISMNCAFYSFQDLTVVGSLLEQALQALGPAGALAYVGGVPAPWLNYAKTGDMVNPAPVSLWVFIDENPDALSTGDFCILPSALSGAEPSFWFDAPSLLHGGGTSFACADGHTEIHKWLDLRTFGPNFQTHYKNNFQAVLMPNNLDVAWLVSRTTANSDGTLAW
jgi:hypothetical protein